MTTWANASEAGAGFSAATEATPDWNGGLGGGGYVQNGYVQRGYVSLAAAYTVGDGSGTSWAAASEAAPGWSEQ